MSLTMKSFAAVFAAICLSSFATASLPNQPAFEPASGDHGAYSTHDALIPYAGFNGPFDGNQAKAYDNFTLSNDYIIDGISWTGIFAEAIPSPASGVDFIIEIWNVDPSNSNLPDIVGGAVARWDLDGGLADGTGAVDVTVTANGDVSPATGTTFGGGPGYDYDAALTALTLGAGDYWISIMADQLYDNPTAFDPDWQWHLGSGAGDGFSQFDAQTQPNGTLQSGIVQDGKDLAFSLHGQLVPEPSSVLLSMWGLIGLGLLRRKRD